MLDFDIRLEDNDEPLASNSVAVNTTNNVVQFDLTVLQPRLEPYDIVLYGAPPSSYANESYTATTKIYYLPAKYNGSTVKVDNLYGCLVAANHVTNYSFVDILPFGFYTDCANVTAYKDLGFNAINPVCSFLDGDLDNVFNWMDQLDLWYQYDMRHIFDTGLNTSQLIEALPPVKDRSNLLSWYTADEPDGWQYALNQTKIAYDILKEVDPYHPTALVLNCDNYYFNEYSSGADYIMEDAYPVGINATYSKWNTTCNETYGDCGCDDCIGELQDVSNRLDDFFNYQLWLGETQKPLWAVLQAFSGEGYWARDPTPDETWAMMLISFNHGAKGIMSWTFPASTTLEQAHGTMAKVATTSPVSGLLVGAQPVRIVVPGHELLDVAYWEVDGTIMLGFANLDYADSSEDITIELPIAIRGVTSQPWGSVGWEVADGMLKTSELEGLATSFVILCA
ncbi:hypothetical protein LTR78_006834 [Recurvomyces mirabilis]|uniref:Uncharacterized protein n=1 Tax=Recurvomyces mirabilis TaxID=574656 RepID=A0AAE0WKA7_9PEZI|nr:hypothetical protein LTR78_006834 [Recurvomyces mirabilis]KAK5153176.1 hypothetical protein LTS14_007821 [Recurvomyces mirabilis]